MERAPYSTDLTNAQWEQLKPLFPEPSEGGRGRPRKWSYREILNAILYVLRTGCQWRNLPHDFPPWGTIYYYFRKWHQEDWWLLAYDELVQNLRRKLGRKPTPSAGCIDSQSAKTTEVRGPRGYDGGKKVNGRKRHIVVDTLGLLVSVVVHEANIHDSKAAKDVLTQAVQWCPTLQRVWADMGYRGELWDWAIDHLDLIVNVVERPKDAEGFVLLPRRWVVERTFAWMGRSRRLSKDYEGRTDVSEAFIYVAMIQLVTKRLA